MKAEEFLVSVADFAMKYNGVLACVGTTNLNTSLDVAMQSQDINAGRGSKRVFSYKYGRELTVNLETANWKLEFIAMQTGSTVFRGLKDVYSINECVQLTAGVGTLKHKAVGKVGVELPNGGFIEVDATTNTTIDLSRLGLEDVAVNATYKYNTQAKSITIDSESAPLIVELVLQAERHNNSVGRVGMTEIVVPSCSLDGNFSISFTPEGVTSTNLSGTALAVKGDRCQDGSAVYAYINEVDDEISEIAVSDIVATASASEIQVGDELEVSVVGLINALTDPIEIDIKDCVVTATEADKVTIETGTNKITGVVAGEGVVIKVVYQGIEDEITITVK